MMPTLTSSLIGALKPARALTVQSQLRYVSQCFKYKRSSRINSKYEEMLSGINLEVLINVYRNLEVIGAYNNFPLAALSSSTGPVRGYKATSKISGFQPMWLYLTPIRSW